MQLELNRATFRRLVLLQIFFAVLSVVGVVVQELSPRGAAFTIAFDELVARYFGDTFWSAPVSWPVMITGLAIIGWMIASAVGLLWFKRWARFGFWASTVAVVLFGFAAWGLEPSYGSLLDDSLILIDSALFGAILLLAYAKDLGGTWFAHDHKISEDN